MSTASISGTKTTPAVRGRKEDRSRSVDRNTSGRGGVSARATAGWHRMAACFAPTNEPCVSSPAGAIDFEVTLRAPADAPVHLMTTRTAHCAPTCPWLNMPRPKEPKPEIHRRPGQLSPRRATAIRRRGEARGVVRLSRGTQRARPMASRFSTIRRTLRHPTWWHARDYGSSPPTHSAGMISKRKGTTKAQCGRLTRFLAGGSSDTSPSGGIST